MFFKKKCPSCGAKNDKERMTCVTCGAPLALEKAGRQVTEPPEHTPKLTPYMKAYKAKGILEGGEDKARDNTLCAHLRAMGLDARMVECGVEEEYIVPWGGERLGELIEIHEGPIRWVNVVGYAYGGGPMGAGGTTEYHIDYIIPDRHVRAKGYGKAKSRRVKSGRVAGVRWKGKLHGNLINRMNEDLLLNQSLIKLKDVRINYSEDVPENTCWAISTRTSESELFPSKELWDCHCTIARYLLEPSGEGYEELVGEMETTVRNFMRAAEANNLDKIDALTTSSMDFRAFFLDRYFFFENYEDIHTRWRHVDTMGVKPIAGMQAKGDISGKISYTDGYTGSFSAHLTKQGGTWKIDGIGIMVDDVKKVDKFYKRTGTQAGTPEA